MSGPSTYGGLNVAWAIKELNQYVTRYDEPIPDVTSDPSSQSQRTAELIEMMHVVEQILNSVLPGWKDSVPSGAYGPWDQVRTASIRARTQLTRYAELAENLGDYSPRLSASALHPWIWEAAKSLWQSAHYRQAVGQAAIKLNAEAQNKAGTRKHSERELFDIVFSGDRVPKPGMPRFILPDDDEGKTADSYRRGVRAFAEGCFGAIRNPASHDLQNELSEHEALEQLAAFSILARWVEQSTVTTS